MNFHYKNSYFVSCLLMLFCVIFHMTQAKYEPTWESLDKRPLPDWYDKAKFGIFVHWGVFSVPSYGSEWFWWYWQGEKQNKTVEFMERNYPPGFTYADFASQFKAEFYDPNNWADLFEDSGAKYVVLTSKHHEGFTLWNSSVSFNWNAMQVGPNRDLVRELAHSIRNRTDIHFGLYHSLFEWFNPLYLHDQETGFESRLFPMMKTIPELYEIVYEYEPEVIWSDGDNGANDTYWKSREFLAWLYNESPVKDIVVTNDRWGNGVACNHGGFYTCADRYNPGTLQAHKWENCMTIDEGSWGYRREAILKNYLSIEEILSSLVTTVSCGGNLLLNVGPTKEGTIAPIFEERLRQIGQWLKVNGEAIYESVPWTHQNDTITSYVWYTSKKATEDGSLNVYALVLKWPEDNLLILGSPEPTSETRVTMLGYAEPLTWTECEVGECIIVSFPTVAPTELESQWVWTLKLTGVDSNRV